MECIFANFSGGACPLPPRARTHTHVHTRAQNQPPPIPSYPKAQQPDLLPETPATGTKVEVRYKGKSRYYPGCIARQHRDGSYDIDYDDGEKETYVSPELVKVVAIVAEAREVNRGSMCRRSLPTPVINCEWRGLRWATLRLSLLLSRFLFCVWKQKNQTKLASFSIPFIKRYVNRNFGHPQPPAPPPPSDHPFLCPGSGSRSLLAPQSASGPHR